MVCFQWTSDRPFFTTGPPHDLQIRDVRSDSLVLLWKPPVYQGRNPVNGYYMDIKEADAPEEAWRGVNTKATEKTYIKVGITWSPFLWFVCLHICGNCVFCLSSVLLQISNLKEGETYVFRVRAQNNAGVGKTSDVTEPVPALTKPGEMKRSTDVQRFSGAGASHKQSVCCRKCHNSLINVQRRLQMYLLL